jgi:uncharacterized flavoprotein (TIGR03862 family)
MPTPSKIAIVGSGPAGLMAATETLRSRKNQDSEVHLFERRPGLGRKLLIAGSSGLNISHELTPSEFASHYEGFDSRVWTKLFESYGMKEWVEFIEKELGLETFLGTSNRYFVREMKASGLLKRWTAYLEERGVKIHLQSELNDFESGPDHARLSFLKGTELTPFSIEVDQAVFALGGGSWETETPAWISLLSRKNLKIVPFEPSNVGYEIAWNKKFLLEAEGKPLKKVILKTTRGQKLGEMVVTAYGLEGTPVYFCGTPGVAHLDLKPDLTEAEIFQKLSQTKENLSPMRRVKHFLALSEAAESLLFHESSADDKSDLKKLIHRLKNLPLELLRPRPLSEAISSRGGVALSELNDNLSLKSYPRIYCVGEMLDWDAPTGGFLIQASISQGAKVGRGISR